MITANFLLHENISNISLNIIGLGIILYILSLVLIYPLIRVLISESKSYKHADELLSKLDEKNARNYLNPEKIEDLQQNPFYKLSILSRNLVIGNEKILLSQISNKCLELIKGKVDENVEKEPIIVEIL